MEVLFVYIIIYINKVNNMKMFIYPIPKFNPEDIFANINSLYMLATMGSSEDILSVHLGIVLDNIIELCIGEYPLSASAIVPDSVFMFAASDFCDDTSQIPISKLKEYFLEGEGELQYLPYYILYGLANFNNKNIDVVHMPFFDHVDTMDVIASYYNKYIPQKYQYVRFKSKVDFYASKDFSYFFRHYPLF